MHGAVDEGLVKSAPDKKAFSAISSNGSKLTPFDQRVHEILLKALARSGPFKEGERRVAAINRVFETEGLDDTPVRELWQQARAQASEAPARVQPIFALEVEAAERPADAVVRTTRRASIAVVASADRDERFLPPAVPPAGLAYDVITRSPTAHPVRYRAGQGLCAARAANGPEAPDGR